VWAANRTNRFARKSEFSARVFASSDNGFVFHNIVHRRSLRRTHRVQQLYVIGYSREARFVGGERAQPAGGRIHKHQRGRYQSEKEKKMLPWPFTDVLRNLDGKVFENLPQLQKIVILGVPHLKRE